MIQRLRNSTLTGKLFGPQRDSYLVINIILAGVVVIVFAYSGIFSPEKNNYPVACMHQKITGVPCASCGISHGFSLILRGDIDKALEWNLYSLRVFSFFAFQLVFRILFSLLSLSRPGIRKAVIGADIALSSLIFLYSFFPFIRQIYLTLPG